MADGPTPDPADEDCEAILARVTDAQWQALWDRMSAVDADAARYEWRGGDPVETIVVDGVEKPVLQMPYVEYSLAVRELLGCIGSLGLVVPFDWTHWDGIDRYPKGQGLDAAPAADAVRLLTAMIRSDRFNEGTITTVIDDGTLMAALDRLRSWVEHERPAS